MEIMIGEKINFAIALEILLISILTQMLVQKF